MLIPFQIIIISGYNCSKSTFIYIFHYTSSYFIFIRLFAEHIKAKKIMQVVTPVKRSSCHLKSTTHGRVFNQRLIIEVKFKRKKALTIAEFVLTLGFPVTLLAML